MVFVTIKSSRQWWLSRGVLCVCVCVYLVSFLSIWVSNGLWMFPRQQWWSELVRSHKTLHGSKRKWQFRWLYLAKGRFLLNIISAGGIQGHEVCVCGFTAEKCISYKLQNDPYILCSISLILKFSVFYHCCFQLSCMIIAPAWNCPVHVQISPIALQPFLKFEPIFFPSDCVLSFPVSKRCCKYLYLFPKEGSVKDFHLHHIPDVMW